MEFKDFLVRAKINTYATAGEGGEKRLNDGSKELIYKEGDFIYRDRYFGALSFVGEEIVFKNKIPIWGMNYCGATMDPSMTNEKVADFLKRALRAVTSDMPFRGPSEFKEGDWFYINQVSGDVNSFSGHEEIKYKDHAVYKLDYHGGIIKK
ncbi:MAG: XRE family transcriptional regulator [Candidatus Colwellbacteria bacterium]|nr:XRE family transcriptional regulator [Candidatus Colwellbacteria bacterium]